MTNKEYWHGIIPALVTPLNEDETLDRDALAKILEYELACGCTGIFVGGSTGEPTNLADEVFYDLVKQTVAIINGRVPICCGVIAPGTLSTIERIKRVQALGIDFVSSTPNFYAKNEQQDDIVRHYEKIARDTNVKMMVYNNLDTTGVNILASTFFKISGIENVISYKDTRSDWENHLKALAFLRDKDISLVNGGEYLTGASFLMGSQANIAAASNVFPRLFVELYRTSAIEKDIPRSLDLSYKIAMLNDVTRVGRSWLHGIKYVMERLGLCRDIVAGNATPLSNEEKYKIDRIVEPFMEYR
jgi:dihydrodipicolinate synthase/N-acetylneuraminate lyase